MKKKRGAPPVDPFCLSRLQSRWGNYLNCIWKVKIAKITLKWFGNWKGLRIIIYDF